jgi:hypothetical protein
LERETRIEPATSNLGILIIIDSSRFYVLLVSFVEAP